MTVNIEIASDQMLLGFNLMNFDTEDGDVGDLFQIGILFITLNFFVFRK